VSSREQGFEAFTIFVQILPPTDTVDILKEHLDLPTNKQSLEGGVIDIDIVDGDFLD
jgi:hypothetical protein